MISAGHTGNQTRLTESAKTDKGSESCALGPPVVFVAVQAHRHGEHADKRPTGETAHFLVRFATYADDDDVIATPRCSMV